MDITAIAAKVRRITKTDTNTYSDANILADLNMLEAEMLSFILKIQGYREVGGNEVYTDLVSTTGLVNGDNGYNGEYSFPDDFLKLKRLEVKFSGVDSLPTTLYDSSDNTHSEYEQAGDGFVTPHVRFDRGSYIIRPLPTANVSSGIHIWYEQRQAALTLLSQTPILEKSFHRIYPLLLAKEYAQENPDKYNQLWDVEIDKLKRAIANHYRTKFKFKKEITVEKVSFK